jgi:MAP/microtubule affinity-regulating kinase
MYTILSSLGHGATAEVNMARHKMLDIVVAIKVYGTNANTEQLQQEVDILQQLAHPNIIKLYYKLQNK